jgi:hypothetical protein
MGKLIYLYIFLVIIFGSLLEIFTFLSIYYFSPTLLMVTDIIAPMVLYIKKSIEGNEILSNIILNNIGYFLVLIGAIIYNELIICNFCDFNKYTKKYIEKRQTLEINLLNKNDN